MPSSDQVDSQPTRPFVGRWYLAGAVSLTVLWLVVRGFAPATGLTRSYHYPYATLDRSTEPVLELLTTPVVEERITAVDLAFIDARSHPARNYLVRWNGVWFSPRPERIDFHAAADDGVVLRLDGEVVIERNSEAGTATAVLGLQYSVPTAYGHREVLVKGSVDEVVIVCGTGRGVLVVSPSLSCIPPRHQLTD